MMETEQGGVLAIHKQQSQEGGGRGGRLVVCEDDGQMPLAPDGEPAAGDGGFCRFL